MASPPETNANSSGATSAPLPMPTPSSSHSGSEPEIYDVVVVGFGGAGACAALEASARGAKVLLLDHYEGGGATEQSGGIVYLGGGSSQQRAAGYDDDSEQMYRYLRYEVADAVDDATLRSYCEGSLDDLAFLEQLGVPFPARGEAPKTSYPADDVTLYFSGNELCPPYRDGARTAPRGHRVLGRGLTGNVLFDHLRRGVEATDVEVRRRCEARRLITDETGRVVGLVVRSLPDDAGLMRRHRILAQIASLAIMFAPPLGRWAKARLEALEQQHGRESEIRARGGVILCAGGFVFNRRMVREHAPIFERAMPLGSVGDDGSGIEMGRAVGGAVRRMDRCAAWRFINPPVALTHGVLVDPEGERIGNEELYGATLGSLIAYEHGGRARLIIDERIKRRILRELWDSRKINFQSVTALLSLTFNRDKARTPEILARLCGMPRGTLQRSLDEYNEIARQGLEDPLGKSAGALHPLDTPPYYAIICDLNSRWFPAPTFTQGGLVVDGASGEVRREDGTGIPGLYSAGRKAVGIASESYVSGLSIGDCVFSGRRAGRHASAATATTMGSTGVGHEARPGS